MYSRAGKFFLDAKVCGGLKKLWCNAGHKLQRPVFVGSRQHIGIVDPDRRHGWHPRRDVDGPTCGAGYGGREDSGGFFRGGQDAGLVAGRELKDIVAVRREPPRRSLSAGLLGEHL